MEKLKDFTITQLLVKAELDDTSNKDIYFEEIRKRNPSSKDLAKAHKALEFIRNARSERADKPLPLGFKILLIFIPFLFYNRYDNSEIDDTLESLQQRGFNRKLNDIRKFSLIGITLYAIIFGTYFILTSFTNFFEKEYSSNHESGKVLNTKRDSLGISLIEPHWYTKDNDYYKSTWSDFKEHDTPHHKEKVVEPNREIDRFINPLSHNESFVLEITYSYSSAKAGENPWTCYLIHELDRDKYTYEPTEISKQEADSVLLEWGL